MYSIDGRKLQYQRRPTVPTGTIKQTDAIVTLIYSISQLWSSRVQCKTERKVLRLAFNAKTGLKHYTTRKQWCLCDAERGDVELHQWLGTGTSQWTLQTHVETWSKHVSLKHTAAQRVYETCTQIAPQELISICKQVNDNWLKTYTTPIVWQIQWGLEVGCKWSPQKMWAEAVIKGTMCVTVATSQSPTSFFFFLSPVVNNQHCTQSPRELKAHS